jgi:hypothetical protein
MARWRSVRLTLTTASAGLHRQAASHDGAQVLVGSARSVPILILLAERCARPTSTSAPRVHDSVQPCTGRGCGIVVA